jgi:transcriptional regulator with XRE-family HTH domain
MRDGELATGETLADRLDRLFRTVRSSRGRPYTTGEAARAIAAAGGPTISPTYLWELRTGRATDPRRSHLQALAAFFGVPPGYFFGGEHAAPTDDDPAVLLALRDDAVRRFAVRLAGLSPATLDALATIVERARTLEGLEGPGESLAVCPDLSVAAGRPSRDGRRGDGRANPSRRLGPRLPGQVSVEPLGGPSGESREPRRPA